MTVRKNQPVAYGAAEYDHFTERFLDEYDRYLVERVLEEAAGLSRPGLLMDVGTGTARLLFKLAARPELEGIHLVGLDYFHGVLDQARRNLAASRETRRISLLRGDVHALPLADRSVDLLISRSTLHHWARPGQALREIYRVLGPGRSAVIHEVRRDPAPEALAAFNQDRARAGLPPSRLDDKFTPGEVEAVLAECGLGEVSELRVPRKGRSALGFEVRLQRPGDGR